MNRILCFLLLIAIAGLVQHAPIQAQETSCEPGFSLFEHEYLATEPVCIPENPQRIVALDTAAVELLLFTDKEIVGSFDTFVIDELSATFPVLADRLASVERIGWPANLEQLLDIAPDMIVTYENETLPYDALSQIAPTVIFYAGIAEGNWQTATQFWSEVFGVEELYAEMEATYNARVAELQTALGEERAETEVSLVLASSYFNLIMTQESPIGYIMQDVGFARPESQALSTEEAFDLYGNTTFGYLSDETLNLADGEVVFIFTFPVLGEEAMAASDRYMEDFLANPLWQGLSATRNDQVYLVGFHWARANTYLQANAVLDDLFAILTNVEPTIPNPIEDFENSSSE